MRKSDKKKNIVKANLIAEQRYLESKGLVKENDDAERAKATANQITRQGGNVSSEDLSNIQGALAMDREAGRTNEERPPMPRPNNEYDYNTMVGTVLHDYFFKGKQNANDAEFLAGYIKALEMEIQQANTMVNRLKGNQSNITGKMPPRPQVKQPNT